MGEAVSEGSRKSGDHILGGTWTQIAPIRATDTLGIYGELSGITDEDSSGDDIVNWGAKLGAKFVF